MQQKIYQKIAKSDAKKRKPSTLGVMDETL
jgi:hypothetical protein